MFLKCFSIQSNVKIWNKCFFLWGGGEGVWGPCDKNTVMMNLTNDILFGLKHIILSIYLSKRFLITLHIIHFFLIFIHFFSSPFSCIVLENTWIKHIFHHKSLNYVSYNIFCMNNENLSDTINILLTTGVIERGIFISFSWEM